MQVLPVRVVGAAKLLGNLIRPMIMSAEDEYFESSMSVKYTFLASEAMVMQCRGSLQGHVMVEPNH